MSISIEVNDEFFLNFIFWYRSVEPNQEPVEFITPQFNQFKYYDISNDGVSIKTQEAFERDRFDLWDNIFNEFKPYWNISFDFHGLK